MDLILNKLDYHLDKLLLAIFALNSLDALMTIVWVTSNLGEEVNPLMKMLLVLGPEVFLTTKLALVSLGSILLWRFRHYSLSVISALVALIAYLIVASWHMYHLINL